MAPGQDHACIVGNATAVHRLVGAAEPRSCRFPTVGVKDQALQWSGGDVAHALQRHDGDQGRAARALQRGGVVEPDLRHWTAPRVIADNAASPDIVRSPSGTFIVTYQTPQGLAYRTSSNASLRSWSAPHPLGRGLAHRMIDAALAFTGHGVILGFKAGTTTQHFEIAWAPTLSGTFRLVGQPDIVVYDDTVENYEFVTVDGAWHLVATSNTLDQPFLFTLGPGDPATPSTWLHWSAGQSLTVPSAAVQQRQRDLERGLRARQLRLPLRRAAGRGLPDVRRQHRARRSSVDGATPASGSPGAPTSCTGRFRRAEGPGCRTCVQGGNWCGDEQELSWSMISRIPAGTTRPEKHRNGRCSRHGSSSTG